MVTLNDIKNRPINEKLVKKMEDSMVLNERNIEVIRYRMEHDLAKWEVDDMTHRGNDLKTNDRILDEARIWFDRGIYTDEEWNDILIPGINKAIEENDSLERWYPGYLIKHKETGSLAIVEGDYAFLCWNQSFGTRNYSDLSIYAIGNDGTLNGMAWFPKVAFELVDKEHTTENLEKIRIFREKEYLL